MPAIMKRYFRSFILITICAVLAAATAGCIKNDLPYPRIPQYITRLAAEGESQPAQLDTTKYTAVIFLEETVDIRNVKFSEFEITPARRPTPTCLKAPST